MLPFARSPDKSRLRANAPKAEHLSYPGPASPTPPGPHTAVVRAAGTANFAGMIVRSIQLLLLSIALLAASCGGDAPVPEDHGDKTSTESPLLRRVPADSSGITFSNPITETGELNYFVFSYMYNGGGVAVGDLNNDGLQDVYFTGNQVHDRVYLNKGGLKFDDITRRALPLDTIGWHNGVSMADVNADGLLDIYVCRGGPSFDHALTSNLLYINQGNDVKGIPTFSEEAERYGIADTTHSTQAAFFDMDGDNDLDLYVLNHPHVHETGFSNRDAMAAIKARTAPTSRLFRNDGPLRSKAGVGLRQCQARIRRR